MLLDRSDLGKCNFKLSNVTIADFWEGYTTHTRFTFANFDCYFCIACFAQLNPALQLAFGELELCEIVGLIFSLSDRIELTFHMNDFPGALIVDCITARIESMRIVQFLQVFQTYA